MVHLVAVPALTSPAVPEPARRVDLVVPARGMGLELARVADPAVELGLARAVVQVVEDAGSPKEGYPVHSTHEPIHKVMPAPLSLQRTACYRRSRDQPTKVGRRKRR